MNMQPVKKKIKIEHENDLEMRLDAVERIQRLVQIDKQEIKRKLTDHKNQNKKTTEIVARPIKTEEEVVCGSNQTIDSLNMERDGVGRAYRNSLQDSETKVTKLEQEILVLKQQKRMDIQIVEAFEMKVIRMEQEIAALKNEKRIGTKIVEDYETKLRKLEQQKLIDNEIMEDFRNKLYETELREGKLKDTNSEASRKVEELSRRILACGEEKKDSDRILEEMRRKESENIRLVEELRWKVSESESANENLVTELSKANNTLKEMKERDSEVSKACEVHRKRFMNLLPIAEELTSLLKMNVEDLEEFGNKFVSVTCPSVEVGCNRMPEKGRQASRNEIRCELDMVVRAFEEDDELCMQAVCALYRQHVSSASECCTQGPTRLLYHFQALGGCELAECLIDGDPELRLMKSVDEVKRQFSDDDVVVNRCRRLAISYSSYFITTPAEGSLFGSRETSVSPLFLDSTANAVR